MIPRSILTLNLMALLLAGCGEEPEQIPTYSLLGTLTSTSVDASQRLAYVKLVASGGDLEEAPLYRASCQIRGPTCDFRINFILEGQYTAHAFVDMNDNARLDTLVPDSGDLSAGGRLVVLWETTRLDYPDSLWIRLP
jgi:hypothetical protein